MCWSAKRSSERLPYGATSLPCFPELLLGLQSRRVRRNRQLKMFVMFPVWFCPALRTLPSWSRAVSVENISTLLLRDRLGWSSWHAAPEVGSGVSCENRANLRDFRAVSAEAVSQSLPWIPGFVLKSLWQGSQTLQQVIPVSLCFHLPAGFPQQPLPIEGPSKILLVVRLDKPPLVDNFDFLLKG